MQPRRYTLVIADRSSGILRRITLSLRPTVFVLGGLFALPVLVGLGARWSASTEIDELRATRQALELENASYRAATGELTTQLQSLQTVISDLDARSVLDPASKKALERLPAVVKSRAVGGAPTATAPALFSAAGLSSPEDTFGILRDLLEGLESSLNIVRKNVERREALAAATPSIWPAHGWLSAGFGRRNDPFTGEPEEHAGLDISTDKGNPIYATANGRVQLASFNGAYGNMVVIDHGFGLVTRYGHLSRFGVKVGERVKRGQVIGYVGATGRATGNHVHYEVLANGKLLNPLRLLTSNSR